LSGKFCPLPRLVLERSIQRIKNQNGHDAKCVD
jgi:hypothetical protein